MYFCFVSRVKDYKTTVLRVYYDVCCDELTVLTTTRIMCGYKNVCFLKQMVPYSSD